MQLGYDIEGKELEDLFWRFKSVAEKKKVNYVVEISIVVRYIYIVIQMPVEMPRGAVY